jgi:hypothetical protein
MKRKKRPIIVKTCPVGQHKFKTRKPLQVYCTPAHRMAAKYQRNKPRIQAWQNARNARKAAARPKVKKICPGCGTEFETSITNLRKIYHDQECGMKHREVLRHDIILAKRRERRARNPEKVRARAREEYRRNPQKYIEFTKARRKKEREKLAKAGRLQNVEGLDLKTGLRGSLAAHGLFNGKNTYEMASDVYPDSSDPFNAIKQLVRRLGAVIEDERKRVSKLSADQRRREKEDLESRLKHEVAKPKKIA